MSLPIFFYGGRGLNSRLYIYYALSLPTELSLRGPLPTQGLKPRLIGTICQYVILFLNFQLVLLK